jgi:hypothetical protein
MTLGPGDALFGQDGTSGDPAAPEPGGTGPASWNATPLTTPAAPDPLVIVDPVPGAVSSAIGGSGPSIIPGAPGAPVIVDPVAGGMPGVARGSGPSITPGAARPSAWSAGPLGPRPVPPPQMGAVPPVTGQPDAAAAPRPAAGCGPPSTSSPGTRGRTARPGPAVPPRPEARPPVVDELAVLGFSRHLRSRVGTRLFTWFFVLVFALILVQLIASLLDP